MAPNRIRYLLICLGIGLLLLFLISTILYLFRRKEHRIIGIESCPRPKKYSTNYDFDYTKNSREFQNLNNIFDYFRLSLSWSPTFCAEKSHAKDLFQCQQSFDFIVHGLWPSKFKANSIRLHPRNCRNEKEISIEIIKKYFCLMPSEYLMQAEWEKHGTCYWNKPEDYFEKIQNLYLKIHLPNNINDILNNQTITKRLRRDYIKQSFLNINPQLNNNSIEIMMVNKGKNLKEVAFCYDLNFNHMNCN